MLIARNQSSDWQQYNIKQNGDDFVLTPKSSSGNLKQFTINVAPTAPSISSARLSRTISAAAIS
jgi:chaperone LolA